MADDAKAPSYSRSRLAELNNVVVHVPHDVINDSRSGRIKLDALATLAQQVAALTEANKTVSLVIEALKLRPEVESVLKVSLKALSIDTDDAESDGVALVFAEEPGSSVELASSFAKKQSQPSLFVLLSPTVGLYKAPLDPESQKPSLLPVFPSGGNVNMITSPTKDTTNELLQQIAQTAHNTVESATEGLEAAVVGRLSDLTKLCSGSPDVGTLFVRSSLGQADDSGRVNSREQAQAAREESRKLQALPSSEHKKILRAIAASLEERTAEILEVNKIDIENAKSNPSLTAASSARLVLSPAKIKTLAEGIRQIADAEEPIGKVVSRLEISPGLILQEETAPIGVLLVIFESRPDCLPQISSLAIRSGNGLLLKGGKEARHSCRLLHSIIGDAIEAATEGRVKRDLIGLVETRSEIKNLLALDDVIDLCIPRGGNALVSFIEDNTKIPVLGHAAGVCSVFVDEFADLEKAVRVAVDAKAQYPAVCNAAEKILLHRAALSNGVSDAVLSGLKQAGVTLFGGPKAVAELGLPKCTALCHEYGELEVTVEIVEDLDEALDHIHKYGSAHTDSIVTENKDNALKFLKQVDSACVFHNTSTRFADGFRFGLGAEVGISTKKIHARGPVGVMGLETTRWKASSSSSHIVGDFDAKKVSSPLSYTHKALEVVPGRSVCQL